MQKAVIVAVVVLVCLPALLYAKGTKASRRTNNREGQGETTTRPKDCGQWTEGQCTLKNSSATCGKGNLVKTRTGDNCPVKQMTVKCKIDCADAPSKGGRNRNNRKTACKYIKGQWSECDAATNTKTRTLTLKTSRRNTSPAPTECEATKVMTKRCSTGKVSRKPQRGVQQ